MCTGKDLTNEGDIDTAWCKGTALGGPSETVLENPSIKGRLGLSSQPEVWVRNTLENVVVVFRRPEDGRTRVRNVPGDESQFMCHAAR